MTHWDQHCDEFLEFADNIIEQSVVIEICEQMCEFGGSVVDVHSKTSLDREGANHEMAGTVKHGEREFGFRCVSGNRNGLEILDWGEDEHFSLSEWDDYYR